MEFLLIIYIIFKKNNFKMRVIKGVEFIGNVYGLKFHYIIMILNFRFFIY